MASRIQGGQDFDHSHISLRGILHYQGAFHAFSKSQKTLKPNTKQRIDANEEINSLNNATTVSRGSSLPRVFPSLVPSNTRYVHGTSCRSTRYVHVHTRWRYICVLEMQHKLLGIKR